MRVFNKPKNFFHVKNFSGTFYFDKVNELAAIDSLLETLKGHATQNECVKKLKARKVEIYKKLTK